MHRKCKGYDRRQLRVQNAGCSFISPSPRADTALRHLARPGPSCLARVKEGPRPLPTQNRLTRPRPPPHGCICSWPLAPCFCLNHLSPLPWTFLLLRPSEPGIVTSAQCRQLCLYFSFGSSFAYKVFCSDTMGNHVCSRTGTVCLSILLSIHPSSYAFPPPHTPTS